MILVLISGAMTERAFDLASSPFMCRSEYIVAMYALIKDLEIRTSNSKTESIKITLVEITQS